MRTTGIILMGVGLGLAVLIAFAGDDVGSGIGVGGGIAIMGLAFLVSGMIAGRQSSWPEYSRPAGTSNATEPVGSRPGLEP
jgi:hypothetical protein